MSSMESPIHFRSRDDDSTLNSVRVWVGGICIKGGGHVWTHEEGADGCSGWKLFAEIDPEDVHLFPEWVQQCYRDSASDPENESVRHAINILADEAFEMGHELGDLIEKRRDERSSNG